MLKFRPAPLGALLSSIFLLLLGVARADEGMWLFSSPPTAQIQARYGFDLTQPWLDHVMRSSVRFNSGGSGSFVSAGGLVITNHHVGLDALQKMSSGGKNFVHDGFYAKTAADEVKCFDLELNVLQSIEDVTAKVNAAIPADLSPSAAARARLGAIARIEQESKQQTGLRSDVVTLYQGGAYHLYRTKRYTDVRLVFAPEQQAAFFGGDPDNFEYPRYDLDICIFRVYENGQPVHPKDYLAWSTEGAKDHELVFVSGHPGHTDRLLTLPELEFLRDTQFPLILEMIFRRESLLQSWSARKDENARRAKDELFYLQNSRKVRLGMLAALQDPAFIASKRLAEETFKGRIAGSPTGPETLAAYERIATAQRSIAKIYLRYRYLEVGAGFDGELFPIARTLLRAGDERAKPNAERLREYADAHRESLDLALFSDKPIYNDLEIVTLADSLADLVGQLGADDPSVQLILAGKSPRDRAADVVTHTRLRDVAFRRQLSAGGASAIMAARDPMIELARSIDDEARALRKTVEAAEETKQEAQAAIARARFTLEGASSYPDATFTLRLSYGRVQGGVEDGVPAPFHTTLAGLYRRSEEHHGRPPFDLAQSWIDRRASVDLSAPSDFISDCDIIGGNSGSPTINRAGQFVGIIFDGDLRSTAGDLGYDPKARALSTDSAGILAALREVYQVPALADELSK